MTKRYRFRRTGSGGDTFTLGKLSPGEPVRQNRFAGTGTKILVGITGDFGAGKSTVARLFRAKGARLLDSDRLAHEVFRKKNRLYWKIRSVFPSIKGRIDRKKIARIVFNDARKRRALERLIHPYVFDRMREEISKRGRRIVVLEVPLLFESGFYRCLDRNFVVKAGRREILKRLSRRGLKPAEVKARWRAQMPLREKIRRSDGWIDNSDDFRETRRQVNQIWKELERSLRTHG